MFSLDNGDLRLALQRGIAYADAGQPWAATIASRFSVPEPYGVAIVNGSLYVVLTGTSPGKVRKLNPSTGAVLADITVGNDPRGICFDGTYIWCANYGLMNGGGNTVSKIDPATDTVVATVVVGKKPVMVEADGAGSVWVACTGSNSAYKINIATNAVTTAALGFPAGNLAYDNRAYMFFGSANGGLSRVRTTTREVTPVRTRSKMYPYGMCSAAGFIWFSNFSNRVFRINRMNAEIVAVYSPASPTRRPGFDGKRVWVPCGDSQRTVVVDCETMKVVADINVGAGSNKCVCFDANYAYIAAGNEIVKIALF
jgi:YVTN family beta-propeller protein